MIRTIVILAFTITQAFAAVRVNISIGAGHPVRRALPTVLVREGRGPVVVRERISWAPSVMFAGAVVKVPAKEHLAWEDAETLRRDEEWVDSTLTVNSRGRELFLRVTGRASLQFAEVHFGNGQAQVVDFEEKRLEDGTYRLLDFADGRMVKYVRIIAHARTPEAKIAVLMAK